MPLTTLPELRKEAASVHGAIAAFQTDCVEMMQAVCREAQAARTPVIVQTTPKCWDYNRPALFAAALKELTARNDIPVCLHLEQAKSLEQIERAIEYGYTSVMFEDIEEMGLFDKDPSNVGTIGVKPLSETRLEDAAGLCAGAGISMGVRLHPMLFGNRNRYARERSERLEYFRSLKIEILGIDLMECYFIHRSGGEAVLDGNIVDAIQSCLRQEFSLILQNGSRLSDQEVQAVVAEGFYAVNFADEAGRVYCDGMKEAIRISPSETDPLIYTSEAMNYVRQLVNERISLCKSI